MTFDSHFENANFTLISYTYSNINVKLSWENSNQTLQSKD